MASSSIRGRSTVQNVVIYFVLFIVINSLGFGLFYSLQQQNVDEIIKFKAQVDHKERLYHEVSSQLGYGQYIHNFKNYLLRGESDYRTQKYSESLEANYQKINQVLAQYRALPDLNPLEIQSMDAIEQMVNQYHQMFARIVALKQAGVAIEEIDVIVKVDDRPAMQGLEAWYDYIETSSQAQLKALNEANALSQRMELMAVFLASLLITLLAFEFFIRRALLGPLVRLQGKLTQVCDAKGRVN
ncbi:MAG: hypothetical protein IE937_07075, partial [Gammaproteobacteria bacterium]|nr:hypothetical protein [Gammaproteobacteria bacterium]